MGKFKFSQRSLDRMKGVDQRLQDVAHRALELSKVDFGIPEHGGLRSQEIQRKLYNDLKSKADGIRILSPHQRGEALDVYAFVDGKASWEREHLAMVAAAMLQAACELGYRLEWGGLWTSFQDMPHFQLKT